MQHMKRQLTRIEDEFDPKRCKAVIKTAGGNQKQCHFQRDTHDKFCALHMKSTHVKQEITERKFQYNLARYKARCDTLATDSNLKNLREEVGILRFLAQKHMTANINAVSQQEGNQEDKQNHDDPTLPPSQIEALEALEREAYSKDMLNKETQKLSVYSAEVGLLFSELDSLANACSSVELTIDNFLDRTNAYQLAYDLLGTVYNIHLETQDAVDGIPENKMNAVQEEINAVLLALDAPVAESKRYDLGKWQASVNEFVTNERVVNLQSEIGVLRLAIEDVMNKCQNDQELIINTTLILTLVRRVKSLVLTTNKLEKAANLLMDEEAAELFAQGLLDIVDKHITGDAIKARIAEQYLANAQ